MLGDLVPFMTFTMIDEIIRGNLLMHPWILQALAVRQ